MHDDNDSQIAMRQQIATEHQHIHRELRETLRLVAERECETQDVAERLLQLRRQLETHFRSETTSGLLTAVVEKAAWAVDQVAAITDEHGVLLEELHRIIQYAHQSTGSAPQWEQLSRHVKQFGEQLSQHETRESELFQNVFTGDRIEHA